MGHNRAEVQSAIEQQYDWVVFGNEYSVLSVLASVGFDVLTDNAVQLTTQTAFDDAQQLGMDFAQQSIARGFNPATDVIYGGTMTFQNWFDPSQDAGIDISGAFSGNVIPLPNKFVPFMGVKRPNGTTNPASMQLPGITINVVFAKFNGASVRITNKMSITITIFLYVLTEKQPFGYILAEVPPFNTIHPGIMSYHDLPVEQGNILGGFDSNNQYRSAIGLRVNNGNNTILKAGLENNPSDKSLPNFLPVRPVMEHDAPDVPGGPPGFSPIYGITIEQVP